VTILFTLVGQTIVLRGLPTSRLGAFGNRISEILPPDRALLPLARLLVGPVIVMVLIVFEPDQVIS
jgi:hypothetical protein